MRISMSKVPWPTTAGWLALAAIGSAALAVYSGRHYLSARENEFRAQARAGLEGQAVVVAAHALTEGAVIHPEDLAVRQVPARFMDSDSLGPDVAGRLVGRRVLRARRGGDALSWRDVDSVDAAALSSRVASGMRAVTLPVDELGSLSGLLKPGDSVDLYFMPSTGGNDARIGLLLSRVFVLATGSQTRTQSLSPGWQAASGFAAITVQLSAEDAERLALAQRVGQVVPVLRRDGDDSPTPEHIQGAHSLLSHRSAPVPANRRPVETPSMEIILGGRGDGIAATDAVSVEGKNNGP